MTDTLAPPAVHASTTSGTTHLPIGPFVAALASALSAVATHKTEQGALRGVLAEINPPGSPGVILTASDRYRAARTFVPAADTPTPVGAARILVGARAATSMLRYLKATDEYKRSLKGQPGTVVLTNGWDFAGVHVPADHAPMVSAPAGDAADYPDLTRLFPSESIATLWPLRVPAGRLTKILKIIETLGPTGESSVTRTALHLGDAGDEHIVVTADGYEDQLRLRLPLSAPLGAHLAGHQIRYTTAFLADAITATTAGADDEVTFWFPGGVVDRRPVLTRKGEANPFDITSPGHLLMPFGRF